MPRVAIDAVRNSSNGWRFRLGQGADNLKLIHRLGLIFFTTLKENRLVSLTKEGGYLHLDQIEWTPERLQNGVIVKLKEVPFKVRLFKLVATNGDIDWVITNCPDETLTAQVAQDANDVRWQVEELHRGLKQLTGSEKCQCRKERSQRNHLACCYHAWLSLSKPSNSTRRSTKSKLICCAITYVPSCGTHTFLLFNRHKRKSWVVLPYNVHIKS